MTLLNSLLVHCFHPSGGQDGGRQPQGNTSADHMALVTDMTILLDGTADDDKARYVDIHVHVFIMCTSQKFYFCG